MRVMATGYYGMSNFGDDLFRSVVESRKRDLWPGATLRVFAPKPRSAASASAVSKLYQRDGRAGAVPRVGAALAGLAWSTEVVLAGGSVFQDVRGVHSIQAFLARHQIRSVSAVGVSFGPFASAVEERRVAKYAANLRRIVVRDLESLSYLRQWELPAEPALGGDLAALYDFPSSAPMATGGEFSLGLLPCHYRGFDVARYTQGVAALLQRLDELLPQKIAVSPISLNHHSQVGDRALVEDIGLALKQRGFLTRVHHYDGNVDETASVIAQQSFNLSTRLHGGIVSYLAGTPFAQVDYHAKCRSFLRDIGAPERLLLPPTLDKPNWDLLSEAIIDGARPAVGVDQYRRRAELAYAPVLRP